MKGAITVSDLDIVEAMRVTDRKKRRYLAILLNEFEEIWVSAGYKKEDPAFKLLRKVILDNVNELTRSWLKGFFTDDVEQGLVEY